MPIPENPLLIGGGYAIYLGAAPLWASLSVWYGAICLGDFILYSLAYLFFKHPRPAAAIRRWLGAKRLDTYQQAFGAHGAWTLFLARFAWGVRLLAYMAAGAAHYPWKRFILVDSMSVLVQVLLFVGLGYVAGDKIEEAQRTGDRIILVLGIVVLIFVALAWVSSRMMKRIPPEKAPPPPLEPPAPQPATLTVNRKVNRDHGRPDPTDL
ncbi:MAG: DedA family protein [Desulfobacterales bacterium]